MKANISITLFIIAVVFTGCLQRTFFEESYYERTTKIPFPDEYEVIETVDNGENLIFTILELKTSDCRTFSSKNKFVPPGENFSDELIGLGWLSKKNRAMPKPNNVLVKQNETGNWIYMLDTTTCKLYCQILYEWGGR